MKRSIPFFRHKKKMRIKLHKTRTRTIRCHNTEHMQTKNETLLNTKLLLISASLMCLLQKKWNFTLNNVIIQIKRVNFWSFLRNGKTVTPEERKKNDNEGIKLISLFIFMKKKKIQTVHFALHPKSFQLYFLLRQTVVVPAIIASWAIHAKMAI